MAITKKSFGKKPCGCPVDAYVLENGTCLSVQILNLGGIITNMWVKDASGNTADVICGFDSVEDYDVGGGYQGALIGRYGNRIRDGRFALNSGTDVIYAARLESGAAIYDIDEEYLKTSFHLVHQEWKSGAM